MLYGVKSKQRKGYFYHSGARILRESRPEDAGKGQVGVEYYRRPQHSVRVIVDEVVWSNDNDVPSSSVVLHSAFYIQQPNGLGGVLGNALCCNSVTLNARGKVSAHYQSKLGSDWWWGFSVGGQHSAHGRKHPVSTSKILLRPLKRATRSSQPSFFGVEDHF